MRKIDVAEQELLLQALQKVSGLKVDAFERVRRDYERKKQAAKQKKTKHEAKAELSKLDEVPKGATLDMHLIKRCFQSSKQRFVVINGAFYQYQPSHGYWKALEDADVLKRMAECSEKAFTWAGSKDEKYPKFHGGHAVTKSALNYALIRLALTETEAPSNEHLRAFSNCTVDMRTGDVFAHSELNYLTSAIAAEYKPGAECPAVFDEFMSMSFGEDMKLIIRAAISMVLDPTAPYGHFIHVIGPSGSGKGVILRLLQELFGKGNSKSGSSFADFATPESRHQNLQGCALYVMPDIAGHHKGLEPWYELVQNGPMSGRELFRSATYSCKWGVRFALGSVEYISLDNTSGGWDRRVLPILSQSRPEGQSIPNLETRLAEVKAEIISWAISMDKELRNDILLNPSKYSERVAHSKREAAIYGDSVKSFVDSCLQPIEFGSTFVEPIVHPGLVYDWYSAYCLAHGLQRKGQPKFIAHLKTVIPNHFVDRRRMGADETSIRDASGQTPIAPAKWTYFEAIPGIFEAPDPTEFDLQSGKVKGFVCNKQRCTNDMLDVFAAWRPIKKIEQSKPEIEPTVIEAHAVVVQEDPDFEEF